LVILFPLEAGVNYWSILGVNRPFQRSNAVLLRDWTRPTGRVETSIYDYRSRRYATVRWVVTCCYTGYVCFVSIIAFRRCASGNNVQTSHIAINISSLKTIPSPTMVLRLGQG
jgi:hypothetical protein